MDQVRVCLEGTFIPLMTKSLKIWAEEIKGIKSDGNWPGVVREGMPCRNEIEIGRWALLFTFLCNTRAVKANLCDWFKVISCNLIYKISFWDGIKQDCNRIQEGNRNVCNWGTIPHSFRKKCMSPHQGLMPVIDCYGMSNFWGEGRYIYVYIYVYANTCVST